MTRFELKCLMAAAIAGGLRASERDPEQHDPMSSSELAKLAELDAERVLMRVEERSTADDNNEARVEEQP